jgi:peptide/nickel transport system ATP-binding protein
VRDEPAGPGGDLVRVTGLTIATSAGRMLVRDVGFTLPPASRLALIGETGSGKSLTSLALIGLLPTNLRATGSVVYADGRTRTEIVDAPERLMKRVRGRTVSIVFQEPLTALDPLARIGRQVAEPLARTRGLRGRTLRRAVADALAEVRIDQPDRIARSFPYEVSGGQRQRAALALALACQPSLLIADEATTALDVTVQAEILALLDKIVRERGLALLFISHDLSVVSKVASRAVVLRGGAVVESGDIDSVIGSPTHGYTRSLVASARRLEYAVRTGSPVDAGGTGTGGTSAGTDAAGTAAETDATDGAAGEGGLWGAEA